MSETKSQQDYIELDNTTQSSNSSNTISIRGISELNEINSTPTPETSNDENLNQEMLDNNEINQEPAVSTLDICSKCEHRSLNVFTEKAMCAAIVCYTCCIAAITTIIIAAVLIIIAMFKGASDNSRGNHSGSGFAGGFRYNYYPMLLYYNLDPILVATKPKVTMSSSNDCNVCCCQMEIPHYYRIECNDCGEILKNGYRRGSLILSIFLGTLLLSLAGWCVWIVWRR